MKKLIFVLSLILGCNISVFAEKIDWRMVKAQILKNSPSVRSAKLTLDSARQTHKKTSLSKYLPRVSLVGTGRDLKWKAKNSQTSGALGGLGNSAPYSLNASISVPLNSTYDDIKSNSIALKIAELNYKRSVSNAILKSDELYLDLIMAHEELEMAKRTKKGCIKNKDFATLQYRSGKTNIGQLKGEEAKVSAAERDLRRAQKRIKEASVGLLVAMGRDDIGTILEVDKQIPFPKKVIKEPDYNSLVTTIPEFLIAQYNFERAKVSKRLAKSAWLPSVSLTGSYSPKVDSKWGVNFKDGDLHGGISLSYDIFTGFGRCYDSKIASNTYQAASSEFLEKTDFLKREAEKYYGRLVDAYEDMETAKNDLELSKLRHKIAQKEYITGILGDDKRCLAEDEYEKAQVHLLDRKKNVALRMAEWCNFTCDDPTKDKEE
ncbi:hypothetical protein AGMMS50222_02950 [Endomicrobiia bacterium]|nr:hypothetical protein AGMMS49556_01700 [Endomicrobiia bacterium]GHT74199.1 hypothetical protein AGMMS50222_02950 [Endomicrobiia bacterium]